MRFALLEHTPPSGPPHWDFLVERAGAALVPTWRLAADPLAAGGAVPAERIADHRPLYLDYEGPVSGGRGVVRRCDGGAVVSQRSAGAELVAELAGQRLRGRVTIAPDAAGRLMLVIEAEPG